MYDIDLYRIHILRYNLSVTQDIIAKYQQKREKSWEMSEY